MIQFLKKYGILENDENTPFQYGPAIILGVLLATFVLASVYVLASSLF